MPRPFWKGAISFGMVSIPVKLYTGTEEKDVHFNMLHELAHGASRQQLHPRAVPLYNALHRFVGPALLAAAALSGLVGSWGLVAALAWAFHVALDRAVGYGLRTREGFQRA